MRPHHLIEEAGCSASDNTVATDLFSKAFVKNISIFTFNGSMTPPSYIADD